MRIPIKTLRQFKILMKVLHKEGYKWNEGCCDRNWMPVEDKRFIDNHLEKHIEERWKKFKSKTYVTIKKGYIEDDKRVCFSKITEDFREEDMEENTIKPFTEANIKKLMMVERLKGD